MQNQRIDQLSSMYSYISGISTDAAKKIILQTPTGKAISKNSRLLLYEQPSSNLYEIILELPSNVRPIFSVATISEAEKIWYKNTKRISTKIAAKPHLKSLLRERLKKERSTMLRASARTERQVIGRTKNADKSKK